MGNHRNHVQELIQLITELSEYYEYKLDDGNIELLSHLVVGLMMASNKARREVRESFYEPFKILMKDLRRMTKENNKKALDFLAKNSAKKIIN